MALSEEQKQQYQECRLQKMQADKNYERIFWGHVVLTAVFVIMALVAGVLTSKSGEHHGATIWYYSFESSMLEMLCAVVTIVLALFAGSKRRIPGLLLLAFFVLVFILAVLPKPATFVRANVVPAGLGIALNIWQQMQCAKLDWLKTQPGYPLFSEEASQPAHFESMYHVKGAQPSDSDMDSLGGRQYAEKKRHGALPAGNVQEETYGFAELDGSQSSPHLTSERDLHPSGSVELDAFAAEAVAGRQATAQPAVSAEALLADMSAEGSSHHKNYTPDESALPSPEDVRARLAAMKNNPSK